MESLIRWNVMRYILAWIVGFASAFVVSADISGEVAETWEQIRLTEDAASDRAREVTVALRELRDRNQDVDVPFGVSLNNIDAPGIVEEQAIPSSFYDISIWYYDRQFAEEMKLPLDSVQLIEQSLEGVKAFQFAIRTDGATTSCYFGVLAANELGISPGDGDWHAKRFFINRMLAQQNPRYYLDVRDNIFGRDLNHVNERFSGMLSIRSPQNDPEGKHEGGMTVNRHAVLKFERIDATYVELAIDCWSFIRFTRSLRTRNASAYIKIPMHLPASMAADRHGGGLLNVELPTSLLATLEPVFLRIYEEGTARLGFQSSRRGGQTLTKHTLFEQVQE